MGQVVNLNSSKKNKRENFPIARNVKHRNDCLENLGSLTVLQVGGKDWTSSCKEWWFWADTSGSVCGFHLNCSNWKRGVDFCVGSMVFVTLLWSTNSYTPFESPLIFFAVKVISSITVFSQQDYCKWDFMMYCMNSLTCIITYMTAYSVVPQNRMVKGFLHSLYAPVKGCFVSVISKYVLQELSDRVLCAFCVVR